MIKPRCVLVEIAGGDAQRRTPRRVHLSPRTTVGREEDNDICLLDTMLSRHHAEFQLRHGVVHIVDLASTNGTYVNGTRVVGECSLKDGDVVNMGSSSLVFHETDLGPGIEEDEQGAVIHAEIMHEPTARTMTKAVDVSQLIQVDHSLGVICEVTNALVAPHALPELFDKVLEAILDSVPTQRAAVMIIDGPPPTPKVRAIRQRTAADIGPIRYDIVERALRERKALLVSDVVPSPEPLGNRGIVPIRSVICAPIWSALNKKGSGRVLGLIYSDSQSGHPPFTERDLHILITLANITATKIENARLMEESLHRQRIEDDVRKAAEIQAVLLPQTSPTIEGYRLFGATEPCRMVGGDYYDYEHDGRNVHLALADVSGKGTGAAMLMVALRATVRAHWHCDALTEATARINQTFHQNVPPDKYATCFLARLDPATGRLLYVNAGHNRPLLIRPNGQWCRLEVGGTVLGAFADTTYHQGTAVLEPGSCLLVFSDGVSDAWPNQEDADRHLVDMVLARRRGEPAELRSNIFSAVDGTNDDRTLLILERLPGNAPGLC